MAFRCAFGVAPSRMASASSRYPALTHRVWTPARHLSSLPSRPSQLTPSPYPRASSQTSLSPSSLIRHASTSTSSPGAQPVRPSSTTPPPPPPHSSPATPKPERPKRRRRLLAGTLAALGLSTALVLLFDKHHIVRRNLLTAYTGLAIAISYKLNFDPDDPEAVAALHERCADLLFRACEKNQGLYIKIGQAVGANSLVLPPAYAKFTRMFDDVERMPWEVAKSVIEAELAQRGQTMDDVFSSFDQIPIAAASVAQVHRATLCSSGKQVAVKVQRPSIRPQAYWDLLCFRILLRFYERIFDLPLAYFGGYISKQIELETHFDAELKNCQRIKEHIAKDKTLAHNVTVPEVFPEVSSDRLLVMDFIKGACKLTDKAKIEEMGLSVRKVASDVCNVFAAMIFQYGFVQADGHAGNVLVRPHPTDKRRGAHQIVLIDHGLYVTLGDSFRRQYAQLWKSIFTVDVPQLESITRQWGMGEASADLFASATLMRPWSNPKKQKKEQQRLEDEARERKAEEGLTHKEIYARRHRMRREEHKRLLRDFLVHVELVPKELIFVGRSMRIVQANNQTLGSPVNRINILARHAADALVDIAGTSAAQEPLGSAGLLDVFFPRRSGRRQALDSKETASQLPALRQRLGAWLRVRRDFLVFRGALLLLDVAFWASTLAHWTRRAAARPLEFVGLASSGKDGGKSGGFEDDLEHQMQRMAKEELGVELRSEAFEG